MNIRKKLAGLILMSFTFISMIACNEQEESNHTGVDSNIIISMIEERTENTCNLQFWCTTTEAYPCDNYAINFILNKANNTINIEFTEIIEPNICLTSIGPARAYINLGSLSNGTYNISLRTGEKTVKGSLVVSDIKYEVNLDVDSSIKFVNSALNRILEHTIWGMIQYFKTATNSDTFIQSFLDSLEYIGATQQTYEQGDYWSFAIDEQGNIVQPSPEDMWYKTAFIYNYTGNTDLIEGLLQRFDERCVKNPNICNGYDYLYITVYTSDGKRFLSWTY